MNNFFQKWVNALCEAFTTADFAYYKSKSGSFNAIVVKGIELYENNLFVEEQEKIIDEFYASFPSEDISFIDMNEVSIFPGLECVIEFQPVLYDWFSNFQFSDISYTNGFQHKHVTSINPSTFALAA